MFQPSGRGAAVIRLQDYDAGGNESSIRVRDVIFVYFFSNFFTCFIAFPSFFHYSSVHRTGEIRVLHRFILGEGKLI